MRDNENVSRELLKMLVNAAESRLRVSTGDPVLVVITLFH